MSKSENRKSMSPMGGAQSVADSRKDRGVLVWWDTGRLSMLSYLCKSSSFLNLGGCCNFQALSQSLNTVQSCAFHALHEETFGPNAAEQYAKLLLGMCAAAARVSTQTFMSVTPHGHFAGLIFLSHDRPSSSTCCSAWELPETFALWNWKHLITVGELSLWEEMKSPLHHTRRYFGHVNLFSHTAGNPSTGVCSTALAELCPSVLSKRVWKF